MRIIHLSAAAFALALTAGCATIPIPGLKEAPGTMLERKPLMLKRAPNLLIADDGTTCSTTPERFERARTGTRVWCVWSGLPAGRRVVIDSDRA